MYRGCAHASLPEEFFTPNEFAVKGAVEFGFFSTSTKREVAIVYARATREPVESDATTLRSKNASILFKMSTGMVDRGADVKWLSQYPGEDEGDRPVSSRHRISPLEPPTYYSDSRFLSWRPS